MTKEEKDAIFNDFDGITIIPYDLPYALQGALGMWETIEKNLNE